MENFLAEGTEHPTVWRRDDESFFPCDTDIADCYLYAPAWYFERHGHDYAAAFYWCLGADGYVSSCVRGVGAQAMKDNVGDPESVAVICAMITSELRADCIAGMTGILAFHHASVAPAEAWCENREGDNRVACKAELKG
jgi:hypothetical protein